MKLYYTDLFLIGKIYDGGGILSLTVENVLGLCLINSQEKYAFWKGRAVWRGFFKVSFLASDSKRLLLVNSLTALIKEAMV